MEPTRIRIHTSLKAAETDWGTEGLAGYAFQSFAWVHAWQDTLGAAGGMHPAVAVVTDEADRVLMLLPLGICRRHGVRTLEFLGGGVTDYHAPLVDSAFAASLEAPAFAGLWNRILALLPPHDVVSFNHMPAYLDPAVAGGGSVPNPMALLAGAEPAGQAQSVGVTNGYDALQKSLKTKFVADTRRRRRRMAELGPVSLMVAKNATEMRVVLDTLLAMKSRRWRETGGRDWFATPAFREFYEAMSRSGLPGGRVHGSVLLVGETPVAVHWGMVYRDRFYHLMLGWEAGDWMRYATGRLITDELIRLVSGEGVRVFDFTVGEETYKQDWVDTALPLFAYRMAATARGRLALGAGDTVAKFRKRAKRVTWLRDAVRRLRGLPPVAADAPIAPGSVEAA